MDESKHCCIEITSGTIVKILGHTAQLNQSVFCMVPETFLDDNDVLDLDRQEVGL